MDEKLDPNSDLEIKLEIPELKEEPEDCNTEYSYAIDEGQVKQVKQETLQDIDNGVIIVEEKKSNNIEPLPSLGRGKEITDFAVKVSTNAETPTGIDDKQSSGVPSVSGCGLQLGLHSELDIKFEPEEDLNEDPLAFDETADLDGAPRTDKLKLKTNGPPKSQITIEHTTLDKWTYKDADSSRKINNKSPTSMVNVSDKDEYSTKTSESSVEVKSQSDKPFACEICVLKFARASQLIRHNRTHTGDKPFACKVCGKKFTQVGYLNVHVRKHTGFKPYVCKICEKQFAASGDLKRHARIHTGGKTYACQICTKTFSQVGYLNTHMKRHTDNKPYVCKICDSKFALSGDLKRHGKIHTGDKPYACQICDKKFTRNSGLKKHQITYNTDDQPYACARYARRTEVHVEIEIDKSIE